MSFRDSEMVAVRVLDDDCARCARRNWSPELVSTCEAFPGGIPIEILTMKVSHRVPVDGDGGLTFLPVAGDVP